MGQLIASPPLYEKLKDELRDYIGRERPRLLPGAALFHQISYRRGRSLLCWTRAVYFSFACKQ